MSKHWAMISMRCSRGLVMKIMFWTLLLGRPEASRRNILSTSCCSFVNNTKKTHKTIYMNLLEQESIYFISITMSKCTEIAAQLHLRGRIVIWHIHKHNIAKFQAFFSFFPWTNMKKCWEKKSDMVCFIYILDLLFYNFSQQESWRYLSILWVWYWFQNLINAVNTTMHFTRKCS